MKLKDVLDGVPVRAKRGDESVEIESITSDSRTVTPGTLFVGIPGFRVDGARFVESAIEKAATAVVSERPVTDRVPSVQVDDARAALSLIAANFYGHPAEKLSLIGVTGTSGKTTTTKMIESILGATDEPVGLIGTIEYRAGDTRELADRTTPDAILLQSWFARMVEAGVKRAVMEVSSHALALKRTYDVPFAAAVFTNLSRDHFDFHKDFEDYFAAKRILFDQIDRSRKTAIVNIDDEYGRRLAKELGAAVVSFGAKENADVHPSRDFSITIDGLRGKVVTPQGEVKLESPLIGMPNLYNWLAAIGAALAVGVEIPTIESGIRALAAVRGRFERVPSDRTTVLIDYAHKPDALEKLLNAVRELSPDRRILLVFGCGGDRDQGKRPAMGEIAGRLADFTIVTSDNPRSEMPEQIISQILEGLRKVDSAQYLSIADRRAAIERAVSIADQQSVVVVAGKGHENYQVVGDQILHFDDREEVELALRKASGKM